MYYGTLEKRFRNVTKTFGGKLISDHEPVASLGPESQKAVGLSAQGPSSNGPDRRAATQAGGQVSGQTTGTGRRATKFSVTERPQNNDAPRVTMQDTECTKLCTF